MEGRYLLRSSTPYVVSVDHSATATVALGAEPDERLFDRLDRAERALRQAALSEPHALAFFERAVEHLGGAVEARTAEIYLSSDDAYVRCAGWPTSRSPLAETLAITTRDWPKLHAGKPVVVRRDRAVEKHLLSHLGCEHVLLVPFKTEAPRIESSGLLLYERAESWREAEVRAARHLCSLFATLWAWTEAEERFHRTVAELDDALFTIEVGQEGRTWTFVTPQVETIAGVTADDLIAGDVCWEERIAEDDRDVYAAHMMRLQRGASSRVDYRVRRPDGALYWVNERATPGLDAAGRPMATGILADITERKEAENQLRRARFVAEQAAQARMAFLRTMSHELRTPLGVIRGFAELLDEEVKEKGGPTREFTATIREAASNALCLVSDLLDLSRLETGALDLRCEPVDVGEVVGRVVASHRGGSAVPVEVERPAGKTLILADSARLEQLLDQLVSNAVKFTDSGRVHVRVLKQENAVTVAVRDTGIGMEEDFVAALFEPFVQEDRRLNRDHGGSGLGLAIAHRLVERMQGRIEVESEKGVGSCFRVIFEASEAA